MVVGKTDLERRVAINTIGPFWDGNEVWLIVAGAAIFAAFPSWYATWFSALYLALMLVLVALIIRGVSFEYRGEGRRPHAGGACGAGRSPSAACSCRCCSGSRSATSSTACRSTPSGEFTGIFWDLFRPYGIWVGLTFLALSLLHGTTFLLLRTTGIVYDRARRLSTITATVALIAVVVFAVWTHVVSDRGVVPGPLETIAVLAIVAALWAVHDRHDGWAFAATAVAMACSVGSIFVNLYPNVMVSSTNPAYNLTVEGTASSSYALDGDDGRGRRVLPAGAPLPGVELLRLPRPHPRPPRGCDELAGAAGGCTAARRGDLAPVQLPEPCRPNPSTPAG